MFKVLTFDFWNTLYKDPETKNITEHRLDRFMEVLTGVGYEHKRETVREAFKLCWRWAYLRQRAQGLEVTPRGHLEYIKSKLNLRPDPNLDKRLYEAYTEALLDVLPDLTDGVVEVLAELSLRYKLAVICNTGATPGVVLKSIMNLHRIRGFFALTVFSDEVGWAKPNTRIFLYTLSCLSVTPEEAVHIGDDALTDVIGARKTGMKAVWFYPRARWPVPECNWHIRSLSELTGIF